MNASNEQKMSPDQVMALAACMLSVAHVDGVHPAEEALIARFYQDNGTPGMPALSEVGAKHEEAGFLEGLASDVAFAEQLVHLCLITGYADGRLSDEELAHVTRLAARVGVAASQVQALRTEVKDMLVASLSHLPVAESVADVAKTL
jgi:uncharacterized tellurite resistance protein B-like protein